MIKDMPLSDRQGQRYDSQCEQTDRHSAVLFRLVFRPDESRVSLREESDEQPPGQQD